MSEYIIVCAVCAWLVLPVVAIVAETVKERRFVACVPSGAASAWVAVVVPLGGYAGIKADSEMANT